MSENQNKPRKKEEQRLWEKKPNAKKNANLGRSLEQEEIESWIVRGSHDEPRTEQRRKTGKINHNQIQDMFI